MTKLAPSILIALLAASPVWALDATPKMQGVGIDDAGKLGKPLPMDIVFADEAGQPKKLSTFFKEGRPVILSLVYYRCPGMCQLEMNYVQNVVRDQKLALNKDFAVLSVSFDPEEKAEDAVKKKATYVRALEVQGVEVGWRFLTGDAANIKRLTEAVGFRYSKVEDATGGIEFAHDSALIILTPDGRISKYLHRRPPNAETVAYKAYEEPTVRFALIEAAEGRIGSLGERFWVSICGYDAKRGEYVMLAQTVMAMGGGATLIGVLILLGLFWWMDRKKRAATDHA